MGDNARGNDLLHNQRHPSHNWFNYLQFAIQVDTLQIGSSHCDQRWRIESEPACQSELYNQTPLILEGCPEWATDALFARYTRAIAWHADVHSRSRQENAFAFKFCPAAEKKLAQLVAVIASRFALRVQREEDFAVRLQVIPEIIEKKLPFGQPPRDFFCAIESSGEGCDPIEFSAEIRQGFEWFYLPGFALDLKKIEQLGEKGKPLQIETHTAMSKLLANEQEKTAAAAQIKNVLGR